MARTLHVFSQWLTRKIACACAHSLYFSSAKSFLHSAFMRTLADRIISIQYYRAHAKLKRSRIATDTQRTQNTCDVAYGKTARAHKPSGQLISAHDTFSNIPNAQCKNATVQCIIVCAVRSCCNANCQPIRVSCAVSMAGDNDRHNIRTMRSSAAAPIHAHSQPSHRPNRPR